MAKHSVAVADVAGKRALVRVDFNVPLTGGAVADDSRIRAALPTIALLRERGARIVLASHLGRPKGKPDPRWSLAPVAEHLAELLGAPVGLTPAPVGAEAEAMVTDLAAGDVLLLENLRFDPGEEANDPAFATALSRLGDLYVNDAFGAAHRAHASVVGVTARLPAYAGLLLERETAALAKLVEDPARPSVAILGGAKVSDKLGVLRGLLDRVDALLLGGGMANTFLLARGYGIGRSLAEPEMVDEARRVEEEAARKGVVLELPVDAVVAPALEADAGRVSNVDAIPSDEAIFDVGPATVAAFAEMIGGARTVFWNGPMGVFERPPFAAGTLGVARAVAEADAFTVVGGGDSVAALHAAGLADRVDHVSTGGGASLEFVQGRTLPGLAALPEA